MNANRMLTGMWVVAIAFVSYYAIKNKFWPYPPTLTRISLSFAVFGIMAMAVPEIATGLAGGFLIAGFLKLYQNGLKHYAGGVPMHINEPGHSVDGALTIPLNIGG